MKTPVLSIFNHIRGETRCTVSRNKEKHSLKIKPPEFICEEVERKKKKDPSIMSIRSPVPLRSPPIAICEGIPQQLHGEYPGGCRLRLVASPVPHRC